MERKIFTHCNIEKNIKDFYNTKTECKIRISNKILKRYSENENNISNQKIIMKKN